MDQEIPDYDMDSEDENWVSDQSKKMEISPLKFEEMMDRLEKGSGQQVQSWWFFANAYWIASVGQFSIYSIKIFLIEFNVNIIRRKRKTNLFVY